MTNEICEEEEGQEALGGMKCRKFVGANEIRVGALPHMGNFGVQLLCKLFNSVLKTEKMQPEWRRSISVPF